MTRETYARMMQAMRRSLDRCPGGERVLRLPTVLCAAAYMFTLIYLMYTRDQRLIRALIVPAVCFAVCTVLRPVIGRERPYDHFGVPPVGAYQPGKGKSMPSRHTASAAAIAFAVAYAFPGWQAAAAMILLTGIIAVLRVVCGRHYPSDVAAALVLSGVISAVGYLL